MTLVEVFYLMLAAFLGVGLSFLVLGAFGDFKTSPRDSRGSNEMVSASVRIPQSRGQR